MANGEISRKPPPAKTFSFSEKDYAWIDFKPDAAAERRGNPADQAKRQAGNHRQEGLHSAPRYPQAAFDRALADCKADNGWQTYVNDTTGHDVMIDQPEWLADVLLKAS